MQQQNLQRKQFKGQFYIQIMGMMKFNSSKHILYPLGSTLVVRHRITKQQTFQRGHDNQISVIIVSRTGDNIVSGQKKYIVFQAEIIGISKIEG
ncbi:unnamed protein product [Paramecium pentaurelia]|uniref:Uncharacterized protein n=1 Tax=Paramecium pentaurelia TaxID=43138 RepID=A0A8S1SAV5_9CILI|nr:unnamed protein product [Paramecium pentaurelia]CAD8137208.1 unnamed protein product [Paramecium pentaurelia]